MASSCIPEALELANRVGAVLCMYRIKVLHVGCQLGSQVALPHKFCPSASLVDFVVETMDGTHHAIVCKVDGVSHIHGETDLMKLQIAAAASDVSIATVGVLYLNANQFLRKDVQPATPLLESISFSSPVYVRSWNVLKHVVFLFVDRDGVAAAFWPSTPDVVKISADVHELSEWVQSTGARRIVSWGAFRMDGCMGLPTTDIEAVVQKRLRAAPGLCMDISQANVMSSHPAPASSVTAVDHLVSLYLGICKRMFFVYIWNGKPNGIYAPSLCKVE